MAGTAEISASLELQVLASGVTAGAGGKITIFTTLLTPHELLPGVPDAVLPQFADSTYLA